MRNRKRAIAEHRSGVAMTAHADRGLRKWEQHEAHFASAFGFSAVISVTAIAAGFAYSDHGNATSLQRGA